VEIIASEDDFERLKLDIVSNSEKLSNNSQLKALRLKVMELCFDTVGRESAKKKYVTAHACKISSISVQMKKLGYVPAILPFEFMDLTLS